MDYAELVIPLTHSSRKYTLEFRFCTMAELRRRSTKKKKKGGETKRKATPTSDTEANGGKSSVEEGEETLLQTFISHPLIIVLPIVLLPYCLYRFFYYTRLQHPEILTSTLGLPIRPGVKLTEERQLLIVGTMSSGTVQVTADLYEQFELEIGHEVSDTYWYFVRDGTVSWFHGIRFIPPPDEEATKVQSLIKLCKEHTSSMGFHPRMYKASDKCSDRAQWNACWTRECIEILNIEWGCGLLEDACETPFRTTLHQVRNPYHTVESLVTKFCPALNETVHYSFQTYMSALFPSYDWSTFSCIEAVTTYVGEYNNAMLEARDKQFISASYRIEETSPCDIADLAGFLDESTAVYTPHVRHLRPKCQSDLDEARQPMTSTKHKVNKGLVKLEWADFHGGNHGSRMPHGNRDIEMKLRALMKQLGYDPEQIRSGSSASESA